MFIMGCCRSRPRPKAKDRSKLVYATGEGEIDQLDEGQPPDPTEDEITTNDPPLTNEMTESARHDSDAADWESKEKALTMSIVSSKDKRYWEFEFKGT